MLPPPNNNNVVRFQGEPHAPLLGTNHVKFARNASHVQDELHSFRSYLRWMCVDQTTLRSACVSWTVFVVFGIAVPVASDLLLACGGCDAAHERPFDRLVQLSMSGVATLSFLCLSTFIRKYGLRRFLFFDKLWDESETVRRGYTEQLNRSLKILLIFVIPSVLAESAYKIWWYASGASQIPFLGNVYASDTVACILEICSWLYRTTVIFLVCVLFRLVCSLQILRLQDFAQVFHIDSDVASMLSEHLRIRRHLRIISHRYRAFILWALILVTISQFAALLVTTKSSANLNIFKAGELALCSMTLVAGVGIIFRSATKITHKAQSITSLAAKWHVCSTLDGSFNGEEGGETPAGEAGRGQAFPMGETDGETDGEDDDSTILNPGYAYSTISFQKRQALVTYFQNNGTGITVYGFTLDRSTLHTIFGIELSFVLWVLGKTIGIS